MPPATPTNTNKTGITPARERQACGQGGALLTANLPECSNGETRDELSSMSFAAKAKERQELGINQHSLPANLPQPPNL